MSHIVRFVAQTIVAVIMVLWPRLVHVSASWMKTPPWLYNPAEIR